jgi:3-deoxy-D-manno-octulosonic-acid transferase
VADEDALFVSVMQSAMKSQKTNPFFVYVPRKPEHFDTVYTRLVSAGLRVTRRSELTPETLSRYDVLLGDSLGEMHFYLGFADRIVVGGGFAPQGSHNIIEPLLHRKPVIIGPSFWTIDFPRSKRSMQAFVKSHNPRHWVICSLGQIFGLTRLNLLLL